MRVLCVSSAIARPREKRRKGAPKSEESRDPGKPAYCSHWRLAVGCKRGGKRKKGGGKGENVRERRGKKHVAGSQASKPDVVGGEKEKKELFQKKEGKRPTSRNWPFSDAEAQEKKKRRKGGGGGTIRKKEIFPLDSPHFRVIDENR